MEKKQRQLAAGMMASVMVVLTTLAGCGASGFFQ